MAIKIIRAVLFLLFLAEGGSKLLGLPFQVNGFENWGYPLWFMYVIGILEVAGAIGFLIPKYRLYANILLLAVIAGAFYTHFTSGDAIYMYSAAILAVILLVVHLIVTLKRKKSNVVDTSKI